PSRPLSRSAGTFIGSSGDPVDIANVTDLTIEAGGSVFIDHDGATSLTSLGVSLDPTSGANTYALTNVVNLTFAATSDATDLSIDNVIGGAGLAIDLTATVGNVTVTNFDSTGNQALSLTAVAGGITLGDGAIDAGTGTVTLNADGAIGEAAANNTVNLIAGTLVVNAGNGVGGSGVAALDIAVDTLEAHGGGAAAMFFSDAGSLTVGYLVGVLRLKVVWELIGQIGVGETGSAYVVDDRNRVVAHSNVSLVLRGTVFDPPDRDGFATGVEGNSAVVASQELTVGDQRFFLITEKPASEAMALTQRTILTVLILMICALFVAGLLSLLAIRIIVTPIKRLVDAAEDLAEGDLERRVDIAPNNEIGALGNAFNSMAERILTTIDDLAFRNSSLQNEVASRQIAEAELENQSRELALSNQVLESHYLISQIFSETGDFSGKAEAALEKLILLTGADLATFRVAKANEPGLHLVAAAGPALGIYQPMPVLSADLTISAKTYTEGKTFVTDDYASHPAASQFLVDMGMQSLVFLPVLARDRTLGLVTVISHNKSHFSAEVVDILDFVVERLGVLVENSILHDESESANQELQLLADALSRSNRELEQFANIASHDLQEPLRMVSSYMQLLESRYKDKLDSDAQEFIGYAVDGAKRMQTQIRDLLAYSRLTTQGTPFDSTDCSEVLNEAIANLSVSIQESNAAITSDALPTVMGDNSQLVSVFQNLIGNAIKYIGDEIPRIHVSAVQSGEDWLFSFSDNGIGIEMQYADRIFLIFQRLHGKDEYDGTGIGLAICKKVVERHGGRIWVESEPDKGSTFYFTLPGKKLQEINVDRTEGVRIGEHEYQTD
ncbi:MAG: HAMP domain-containing protein, partial [Chloroflexi bacterium]|nr:HAMP domain-containing protein [Chloroflexota bacterium]